MLETQYIQLANSKADTDSWYCIFPFIMGWMKYSVFWYCRAASDRVHWWDHNKVIFSHWWLLELVTKLYWEQRSDTDRWWWLCGGFHCFCWCLSILLPSELLLLWLVCLPDHVASRALQRGAWWIDADVSLVGMSWCTHYLFSSKY